MMKRIEASCEKLIHLFINGSYYVKDHQAKIFFDAFSVIAGMAITQPTGRYYPTWEGLRKYPTLLLAYASGISAFAGGNYALLKEITSRQVYTSSDDNKKNVPIQINIYTHSVIDPQAAKELISNRSTSFSDYLFNLYSDPIRSFVANEIHYEKIFDDFEYAWCLLHVDGKKHHNFDYISTPYGSFIWRRQEHSVEWLQHEVKKSIEKSDNSFSLLENGLFGKSLNRLKSAYDYAQSELDKISPRIRW